MGFLSAPAQARWNRFKRVRLAYWSLWILGVAFFVSLFSEFIANNKPIVLGYEGGVYFPVVKFYPETAFGGEYGTEPNYRRLVETESFKEKGGWAMFPPVPYSPLESHLDLAESPPHPPSTAHWLGTDSAARDVFARLLYGFRISMGFSLLLNLLALILALLIGGVQGYAAGKVDLIGQRFVEIWSALPMLYVVILVGAIYGRSFSLLLLVCVAFAWEGMSAYVRAEFLKLRQSDYVTASKSAGAGHWRILWKQILPNAWTPIITLLPFGLVGGISTLTALDFLGFGLQPPTPSWGQLLDQGLKNLQAPWLATAAVSALFITLLLATFIGEGAREALDPKSLSRMR